MAREIWKDWHATAPMDDKKAFLKIFFFDYFRKSAAADSPSRPQWFLLLKEHALFVTALSAEFFRNCKEALVGHEYDILNAILKYSGLHTDTPTVLAFTSQMTTSQRQDLIAACAKAKIGTRTAVVLNLEQFLCFPAMN